MIASPLGSVGRGWTSPSLGDAAALAVLAGLELVALAAVVGIWREKGRSAAGRILWTAVTLVPVLGLMAYAVWRDPPPPSDPVDRPPERWD